jgi:transcriptional regulator with XRE-family HTH domain
VDNLWTLSYDGRMAATDTPQVIDEGAPKWTLADRLMKSRRHAGLEQPELADAIGIARSSLSAYENGHRTPRRPVLLSWALATGVPLEWLLNGYGEASDQGIPMKRCTRAQQGTLWEDDPEPILPADEWASAA